MLTITVLSGFASAREEFVVALATRLTHLGIPHHITSSLRGDITLLLGMRSLDTLPGAAGDLADQAIRSQLHNARQPYQVLYGSPEEQLAQALRLILGHAQSNSPARVEDAQPQPDPPSIAKPWRWACDKCSDAGCEHKLLTDLLTQRAKPG